MTDMARKIQTSSTRKTKLIADQAVALAEYAAKALVAAEQLRIKTKAVEQFPLDEDEQATLAGLPALAAKVKRKLAKGDGSFTVAEVASMVLTARNPSWMPNRSSKWLCCLPPRS
jgi:hypothetical protein